MNYCLKTLENIEKLTKAYKSIFVLKKLLSAFLIIYTAIKVVTFFVNKQLFNFDSKRRISRISKTRNILLYLVFIHIMCYNNKNLVCTKIIKTEKNYEYS